MPGAEYDDQRTGPLVRAAAVDIEEHRERGQSEPGYRNDQKLCDGLEITLVEFFDTEEFRALEQEIQ